MLLSTSYTYIFQDRPMAFTLGMDLNIPIGKERLNDEEIAAEWGESSDLFEVDNFGEGFNISLSLGIMRQFGNAVAALQGAYVYNGEFDPTEERENDDLDPGDQILTMGLLKWEASSWCKIDSFISYSYFLADKTGGADSFRQGPQVVVGSNLRLTGDSLDLFVGLQGTFSAKSEILGEFGLEQEPENSTGNDLFALTALIYKASDRLNLRLQGDMRYYGESKLEDQATSLAYAGKRVRYAVGPGFHFRVTDNLSCTGLFKFFSMDQDRDVFVDEDLNYKGMNLALELSYTL